MSIRDIRVATECERCDNKCCSQPYDWVYLTAEEVVALERASGVSSRDFVKLQRNPATKHVFKILSLPCPFLEQATGACTVYESRPLICRLFPFYPEPLTGHVGLMPAQCGTNMRILATTAPEGWRLADFDVEIKEWLYALWGEVSATGD